MPFSASISDSLPASHVQQAILHFVRDTILACVHGESLPEADPLLEGVSHHGVFVTLHVRGTLRGCIGTLDATLPLSEALMRSAMGAATRDCRFESIRHADLEAITVEVSLLGPPHPISGPDEIIVGRHGLLLETRSARGLLLPQVAVEFDVTAEGFLDMLCRKAGVPKDTWKNPEVRLSCFPATVISDSPSHA